MFVPSIAISNLVAADPGHFPRWEGDLLVTSLVQQTIYRLRLEGDRVVYSEPIRPPDGFAEQLRDVIVLADGRLAIGTDGGHILLVSDAADPAPLQAITGRDDEGFRISAFERDASSATRADTPLAERGRALFEQHCASCHRLTLTHDVGPGLAGIVGREIGSAPGYGYSRALRSADGVWSEESLLAFLSEPEDGWAGTTMLRVELPHDEYEAIVAYLTTVRRRE